MSALLVKNALQIVTMNDENAVVSDSDILIEGNRISKIGKNLGYRADRVIEADFKVVLPGFINTHHHLFQTLFRCLPAIQNKPLFPWLTYLYEAWRHLDAEAVYWGAMAGIGELLLSGCTTTTDHFYVYPRGESKTLLDQTIKAAKELGIRFYPTRGSISLGRQDGGLPPDDLVQSEGEILEDCGRVISSYHDASPFSMCRIGLSPNAPFTATAEVLRNTVKLARQAKVMCHTHLAETADEEKYCLQRFGKRPLAYLEELGWVGEDIWFAHGIHFNDEEMDKLAKTKTKISHCPTSNCRLGSGIAPLPKWREKGVIFSLGVDGGASNDSSNLWAEIRQCLLLHRAAWGSEAVSVMDALSFATRGGSKLLGWPQIGELSPGKAADLIMVDVRRLGFAGGACHDPVAALFLCGDNFRIDMSIINGKVVVENGRLALASGERIAEEADHAARRITRHLKAERPL